MKIFLDDERGRPPGWILAENVTDLEKCIFLLGDEVEEISLDNDLGEDEEEGKDFLKRMEEFIHFNNNYVPPIIHIHTANTVASKQMVQMRESIQRTLDERGVYKNIIGTTTFGFKY